MQLSNQITISGTVPQGGEDQLVPGGPPAGAGGDETGFEQASPMPAGQICAPKRHSPVQVPAATEQPMVPSG